VAFSYNNEGKGTYKEQKPVEPVPVNGFFLEAEQVVEKKSAS
jgi:hypothetical protein